MAVRTVRKASNEIRHVQWKQDAKRNRSIRVEALAILTEKGWPAGRSAVGWRRSAVRLDQVELLIRPGRAGRAKSAVELPQAGSSCALACNTDDRRLAMKGTPNATHRAALRCRCGVASRPIGGRPRARRSTARRLGDSGRVRAPAERPRRGCPPDALSFAWNTPRSGAPCTLGNRPRSDHPYAPLCRVPGRTMWAGPR